MITLPQQSILFNKNVVDNITLGREYSLREIQYIASKVNMPNSLVFERSAALEKNSISGGENKKINLARTLITRANFIILDEFETSLDKESYNFIINFLLEQNRTIIFVTHNMTNSFLNKMDMIIHMENGRIAKKVENNL